MKNKFTCNFFFKDSDNQFSNIIETIIENYVRNIINGEINILENN